MTPARYRAWAAVFYALAFLSGIEAGRHQFTLAGCVFGVALGLAFASVGWMPRH